MGKKFLNILTNNLGFKILAVLFATALWFAVYNIDDPTKSKYFTTVVEIQNANSVTGANKYFEVVDGTNQVTFKVTAKRSVLDKLEDRDFTATADMSKMVVEQDGKFGNVLVDIQCSRSNSSIAYSNSNKYLRVELDELMSKQFVITATTKGAVAEGYALGDVTVSSSNVVRVSGPASIVEKIDKVVASVDVEGMFQDMNNVSVVPIYYDAEDQVVDTTKLTLSPATCTLSVKILGVKTVLLHFDTSGTPAESYSVVGIKSDPEEIRIKGTTAALNKITTLDVPGEALNVSALSQNLTTTVNVAEYLPEGISLVDSKEANVSVTVRLEPYQSKNYSISTRNIEVQGLGEEYSLSYTAAAVTVPIAGMQSNLDVLKSSDLKAAVDVTGLSEGEHVVDLQLPLDEEKYAVDAVRITVILTLKETGEENDVPVEDDQKPPSEEE